MLNNKGGSPVFKLQNAGALSSIMSGNGGGRVGSGLILVGDVSISDSDISLPVVATDNFRALYRFGKDFGKAVISGTAFLGATSGCSGGGSQVLSKLVSGFESARLSTKKSPAKLSVVGGKAYPLYFVGFELSGVKADQNSIDFKLIAIIAAEK